MFELSLQQCAKAMGARLVGEDVHFSSVSTDTRRIEPGDVFVALIGERFDAHDLIDQSLASTASALVVNRELDADVPQLVVADTLRALGDIARQWRKQLAVPVVAITGSNGKTTVKEMTAAILRQRGNVFATRGNLNNEIGLPLSLLSTQDSHDFVVLELGANHAGEIAYLTDIAKPIVALVNNAGPSHLEGFGSLDGVATAKGEIYSGLGDKGVAIINADDRYADQWRGLAADRRILTFGFDQSADVRGELSDSGELTIHHAGHSISLNLPLRGRHNAMNALAASAATIAVETSLETVAAGLKSVRATSGRLEFKRGVSGAEIIDDSYNANPGSLQAGLQVLCDNPAGRTWCVLGDMRELGDEASLLHRQMGRSARQLGVGHLCAVGEFATDLVAGFGQEGRAFESVETLIDWLAANLRDTDRVLVKGSRGARMERVVTALVAQTDNNKNSEKGVD